LPRAQQQTEQTKQKEKQQKKLIGTFNKSLKSLQKFEVVLACCLHVACMLLARCLHVA
jgi:hypothetical protein